jgi:hypothetical protein
MELGRTKYWTIEAEPGTSIFRLRRNALVTESLHDMERDNAALIGALARFRPEEADVLVDLREGPMRNDRDFEVRVRPYVFQVLERFRRVAMLVGTPIGQLQVTRMHEQAALPAPVFIDEGAALAHLRGGK